MCVKIWRSKEQTSLAPRPRAESLKSISDCFLGSQTRSSRVYVAGLVATGFMCWVHGFWHRRLQLHSPCEPPSGLMKDFLNLAQSVSFRTQRPFSARVRVRRFPFSGRRRPVRGGPGQGRGPPAPAPAPRTGSNQQDLPPEQGDLHAVPLYAFGACVGWRQPCPAETEVLVRFSKLSSFFS